MLRSRFIGREAQTNILLASATDDGECDIFARALAFDDIQKLIGACTRWPSTATMRSAAPAIDCFCFVDKGALPLLLSHDADPVKPGLLGGSARCHCGDQEPPLALVDTCDASVGPNDMPALDKLRGHAAIMPTGIAKPTPLFCPVRLAMA